VRFRLKRRMSYSHFRMKRDDDFLRMLPIIQSREEPLAGSQLAHEIYITNLYTAHVIALDFNSR
jgi:hypothetical protein